jgi:hypothetical protein
MGEQSVGTGQSQRGRSRVGQTGFRIPYAQAQGVPPEAIRGFMESLGRRNYLTDEPRPSWYAFVRGVKGY